MALTCCLFGLSACAGGETPVDTKPSGQSGAPAGQTDNGQTAANTGEKSGSTGQSSGTANDNKTPDTPAGKPDKTAPPNGGTNDEKSVQVVSKPSDIAVLVNKTFRLPENYKPDDLVEPDIPFIFKEKSDKRLMRKEAAGALEKLVAAAKKDGVSLAGVSGYRSEATQKSLFDNYVKKDGEEAARKYSAVPGFSEHQTGLAMDVSGSDGKCAASDCFAGTKEAKWLAAHSAEYGFIIRYPKGKDDITGYQYEPWHLRYVGTKTAKEITDKGLTLEEFVLNTVTASK